MMPQTPVTNGPAGGQQIYIACAVEDLIGVEMDAWKRGYDRAREEGPAASRDIMVVERIANDGCDEALKVYVPLDLTRFCDVFVRAWCGGYFTRLREQPPRAASPLSG